MLYAQEELAQAKAELEKSRKAAATELEEVQKVGRGAGEDWVSEGLLAG